MAAPEVDSLTFRRMTLSDLPRLHGWMNAPHARAWFGQRAGSLGEVTAEYGDYIEGRVPILAYIVTTGVADGARPIGMFTWERLADFPEVMSLYGVTDPGTANCDVLIGEPDWAHRGLGAPLLRRFLAEIMFADPRVTCCVIDPEVGNAIAIRAYEKAGFRWVRTAPDDGEGKPVYLMELARSDFQRA